jgi:hypothetical protein
LIDFFISYWMTEWGFLNWTVIKYGKPDDTLLFHRKSHGYLMTSPTVLEKLSNHFCHWIIISCLPPSLQHPWKIANQRLTYTFESRNVEIEGDNDLWEVWTVRWLLFKRSFLSWNMNTSRREYMDVFDIKDDPSNNLIAKN